MVVGPLERGGSRLLCHHLHHYCTSWEGAVVKKWDSYTLTTGWIPWFLNVIMYYVCICMFSAYVNTCVNVQSSSLNERLDIYENLIIHEREREFHKNLVFTIFSPLPLPSTFEACKRYYVQTTARAVQRNSKGEGKDRRPPPLYAYDDCYCWQANF